MLTGEYGDKILCDINTVLSAALGYSREALSQEIRVLVGDVEIEIVAARSSAFKYD